MLLNSRKITLFAAFAAAKVEYVVVGGVAVNLYGYQRGTQDLDVLIRPTLENAECAFQALYSIGVPLEGFDAGDLLVDYDNIRYGPREDHVDVLNGISGVNFDDVWRNREEITIEGITVPVISKKDLIASKQEVGRLQDLADIEVLQRLHQSEPDASKLPVEPIAHTLPLWPHSSD